MKTLFIFLFCFLSIHVVCYSQWVQTAGTPEGGGITDMLVTPNGTLIVTCASYNWPNGQSGGIRHSTNNGTTWENDYQHYTARTLAMGQNGYVYASSWDYPNISEGLWVSFNQGAVWQGHLYLIGSNNNIFSILVRDNNQTIYIGTRTGVRKSTNGGGTFTPVNNGIPANSWVRDLEADSTGIIAAATTNGVFISTNSASSWVQAMGIPSSDTITALNFVNDDTPGDGIYTRLNAGSNNGRVFESTIGQLYLQFGLMTNFPDVSIIDFLSITLFPHFIRYLCARRLGFDNLSDPGIYQSTNSGSSWIPVNEGLPSNALVSVIAGNYTGGNNYNLYIGLYENSSTGAKVFKRTFPIGIQQISSDVPNTFSLSQNYPNPFNPMTKIKFNVSRISNINITVFDVLGQHVTTLVNEKLIAGSYEAEWNAADMPGGVYFYRIETDDLTVTKKMILIK